MSDIFSAIAQSLSTLKIERNADGELTVRQHYGWAFWLPLVLPSLFIVGLAWDQYRKYSAYIPVDARITRVVTTCRLYKKTDTETMNTKLMPCDAAKRLAQERVWADAKLITSADYFFEYRSPVDNKSHEGHTVDPADYERIPTAPGAKFRIRASKTRADAYREV